MSEEITKVYIVQKVEHIDSHPNILGNCLALSEEEVEFVKSQWNDANWGDIVMLLKLSEI